MFLHIKNLITVYKMYVIFVIQELRDIILTKVTYLTDIFKNI